MRHVCIEGQHTVAGSNKQHHQTRHEHRFSCGFTTDQQVLQLCPGAELTPSCVPHLHVLLTCKNAGHPEGCVVGTGHQPRHRQAVACGDSGASCCSTLARLTLKLVIEMGQQHTWRERRSRSRQLTPSICHPERRPPTLWLANSHPQHMLAYAYQNKKNITLTVALEPSDQPVMTSFCVLMSTLLGSLSCPTATP